MKTLFTAEQRSCFSLAARRDAFSEILVPTDFSTRSNRAVDYAVELARGLASHLTLLHVVPAPFALDYTLGGVPNGDWEVVRQQADRKLEGVLQHAKSRYEKVDSLVRTGSHLHEEIVDAVMEVHAKLIVLSSHEYKGWRHVLFGSDADDLLLEVPCPALVIR